MSGAITARAEPPGPRIASAGTGLPRGIAPVWDVGGSGEQHFPGGARGGWHTAPGQNRWWNGVWVAPYWGPNRYPQGWGPYGGQGHPTYWVWGPSGGAFDYPFADWRGPTGG